MKYFINLILLTLSVSCTTTNKQNSTAYFGGQIVNPKDKYVLFLKDDVVIDTLTLDNNNRFLKEYQSLDEGLYTFKHGGEFQYIYFEPTDSILVRLNTWDFDESIVFSGNGSSKNEFLINLFLQNEKEEKYMYQNFYLDEHDFMQKIDSLSAEKNSIYKDFVAHEDNTVTEGFEKLSNAAINFPLDRLKEVYPYYYKRVHNLDKIPEISEDFYNYRDQINLNEESLLSFYPYQNYLISYLYHLSYELKEKDSTKNNMTVNVLNSINENIESENIKNTLLKRVIVNDFLKSESTCSINNEALDIFLKNCTNQKFIEQVESLVNDSKYVVNNQPIHNFDVTKYNNSTLTINDIIKDQNTVIYFWSTEYMSSEYLINRIKYLEKTHPNVLFVGINMKTSNDNLIADPYLKQLDSAKQYKLTGNSYAYNYLTSKYPRVIIVNNKGVVENGFTYLDSRKLTSEINKLEKN
ncbi:hypothetical protein [Lutibacter sp. B1]|uniref:TlpA family protein disulfide reductase n=1 Tax=Lutibacter sp. B1 TaxID=2725996 RepID=UPI001456DA6D|nr:hypothetical protein [Lutibacter sp. B1]NLP56938.1 hypothetical protein [Lutibacter sp. B1]